MDLTKNHEVSYSEDILKHYTEFWKVQPNFFLWHKGPFEHVSPSFRVLEFEPSKTRSMWTYATCGMSSVHDILPIELHMFSSVQDRSLIELMTAVAYYHQNTTKLGLNHTVNFGRPWQESSLCDHGFISLPYLDGPKLEDCYISDYDITVKCYWLIPVTKNEINFKKQHGVEALEDLFDSKGLDYISPNRKSLV